MRDMLVFVSACSCIFGPCRTPRLRELEALGFMEGEASFTAWLRARVCSRHDAAFSSHRPVASSVLASRADFLAQPNHTL